MFRRVITVLVLAAVLVPAAAVGPREQETEAQVCTFTLGFAALRNAIIPQYGDIVGACLENEWHNAFNGDALQQTTGGLMVWRKCDNWTAFTNGSTTWINGPQGLVTRPNQGPLFPFEVSNCPAAPAPPPPPPPPPPPGPAAPTATPTALPDSRPAVDLDIDEDRPRQGETFRIRIEANDPDGLESVWWWATSTDDDDLRDTETRNCRGSTPCRESWEVSTQDTGEIVIHAQARDRLGNISEEVTKEIRVREAAAANATQTP